MSSRYSVLCLLAACLPAAELAAQEWVQRGPQGAWTYDVKRAGTRLLLGTAQGLHVSADEGATWSRLTSLPEWQAVQQIAVNPRNPDHWYVSLFETFPQQFDGYYIANSRYLVRETRNGGLSWQVPTFRSGITWLPTFHPGADRLIVEWPNNYAWQYSSDAGLTWTEYTGLAYNDVVGLDLPGSPFAALDLDSANFTTMYFRLGNSNGSQWGTPVATLNLPSTFGPHKLMTSSQSSQKAFWLAQDEPLRTHVGSVDFLTGQLVQFPTHDGLASLLLDDPVAPGTVLMAVQKVNAHAGYAEPTFLTALAPGATQWSDRGSVPHSIKSSSGISYVPELLADGATRLWFSDNAVGLRRSDDGGATWQVANAGLQAAPVNAVLLDARDPDRLLAGRDMQSLQRSVDAGQHWSEVGGEVPVDVRTLARSPVDPDHLLATARDGLYRSRDAGQTWQRVLTTTGAGDIHGWREIVWCANNDNHLLATVYRDLYRSLDGGANWSLVRTNEYGSSYSLQGARQAPQRVYIANSTQVYRSDDCGASLVTLAFPAGGSRAVAVDPHDSSHLAVSIDNANGDERVAISTDAGASWQLGNVPATEWLGLTLPLGWFDACDTQRFTTGSFFEAYGWLRALHPMQPRLLNRHVQARAADSHCIAGSTVTVVGTNHGLWLHRPLPEVSLFANGFEPAE